jgi:hypothetical protein
MSDSTNDKNLQAVFQQKFENETATPPPLAWGNIKAALPPAGGGRRIGGWYWVAGLLLLGSIGTYLFVENNNQKERIAKNTTKDTISNSATNESQNELEYRTEAELNELQKNKEAAAQPAANSITIAPTNTQNAASLKTTASVLEKKMQVAKVQKSNNSSSNVALVKDQKNTGITGNSIADNKITVENTKLIEQQNNAALTKKLALTENAELETALYNLPVKQKELIPLANNNELVPFKLIVLKPIVIFKPWSIDMYAAAGNNYRKFSTGINPNDLKSNTLSPKSSIMHNRAVGLNVGYRFSDYFSIRTGMSLGGNRFTSNFYQKKIYNSQISQQGGLEVSSSDGSYRIAATETADYFNSPTDSVIVRIRLQQHSSYISIPINFRFTLPSKTFLQPYLSIGTILDIKSRERSRLIIDNNGQIRTSNLTRLAKSGGIKPGFQFSLGLSTSPNKTLGFFTELGYAQPFSPTFTKGNLYRIDSKLLQLKVGISLNF